MPAVTARVATVAGRRVTVADVCTRVAAIRRARPARLPAPATAEARRLERWVAQLLVTETVVAHEARALGLPADSPRQAAAALFDAVTADVTVPEPALRDHYTANADRYRLPAACRVRHILVADEGDVRHVGEQHLAGREAVVAVPLRGVHRLPGDVRRHRQGVDAHATARPAARGPPDLLGSHGLREVVAREGEQAMRAVERVASAGLELRL
jgi:hypothetical protein